MNRAYINDINRAYIAGLQNTQIEYVQPTPNTRINHIYLLSSYIACLPNPQLAH